MPNTIYSLCIALIVAGVLPAIQVLAGTKGDSMGAFVELRDARTAPELRELGMGWVRFMYDWTWLEPQDGKWVWQEFDEWIARARAQHLKVLVVAQGTPSWANGGIPPYGVQDGVNTPPLPQFYGRFAHYAAELARHGADAIEIWNEPNAGFWVPAPNPKVWAKLVTLSCDAVKAADARVLVISGGCCAVPPGPTNPNSPEHFLEAALQAEPEMAQKVDGVGHHPYVIGGPGANDPLTAPYQYNTILQTETLQKIMARYGGGDKAFWFTEYGVPTGGPFGAVKPENSGLIYDHYYQAFDRLTTHGIKLGPMFFFSLHDDAAYRAKHMMEGWEGVYDLDGKPKPSVGVIRARAGKTD